jgi:Fe2+ transport system protein FeoA
MTTWDTPDTANFNHKEEAVSIDSLPEGATCRIWAIDENAESLLRLMEMGLIPGARVVVQRRATFKSPYCLRLSGCTLAVRPEDAARVMVVLEPFPVEENLHP